MKITGITITPCVMRKEDPTWRFALGSSPTSDGLIVTIATDARAMQGSDNQVEV